MHRVPVSDLEPEPEPEARAEIILQLCLQQSFGSLPLRLQLRLHINPCDQLDQVKEPCDTTSQENYVYKTVGQNSDNYVAHTPQWQLGKLPPFKFFCWPIPGTSGSMLHEHPPPSKLSDLNGCLINTACAAAYKLITQIQCKLQNIRAPVLCNTRGVTSKACTITRQ
jgi:hypothetical protein